MTVTTGSSLDNVRALYDHHRSVSMGKASFTQGIDTSPYNGCIGALTVCRKGPTQPMSTPSLLFFAGLAVAMVYCYLGIRRQWGPPWRIAAIGTALCAIAMSLVLATNNNADPLLAIVYGVPLGAVLAIVTIIAAMYFTRQSARTAEVDDDSDA